MNALSQTKRSVLLLSSLLLVSCGDFPEYGFSQSSDYCVMSFPFAGGIIGRQYVGYFRIISSLQYLDEDPSQQIVITEPSNIILEPGSVQSIVINDQIFKPEFKESHLQGELQLLGSTFTFTQKQSDEIYALLQQSYDLTIIGRIEVGHPYETDIYNFSFESKQQPFKKCINRLLTEEELQALKQSQ